MIPKYYIVIIHGAILIFNNIRNNKQKFKKNEDGIIVYTRENKVTENIEFKAIN